MSVNIVAKIKSTELEAEKVITAAKAQAKREIDKAEVRLRENVQQFKVDAEISLKNFRKEKEAEYKKGAEKIVRDGLKENENYSKQIEKHLPKIQGKIEGLVRKELCL